MVSHLITLDEFSLNIVFHSRHIFLAVKISFLTKKQEKMGILDIPTPTGHLCQILGQLGHYRKSYYDYSQFWENQLLKLKLVKIGQNHVNLTEKWPKNREKYFFFSENFCKSINSIRIHVCVKFHAYWLVHFWAINGHF